MDATSTQQMHSARFLFTFYILFAPVSAVGPGLTYNWHHAMEWNKSNYAEARLACNTKKCQRFCVEAIGMIRIRKLNCKVNIK